MGRDRPKPNPVVVAAIPVRPAAFAVLACLAEGPKAGFEVLSCVNASSPGLRLFGPGTLYRLLRDLRREKLIERVPAPHADTSAADERRTYHGLTALGRGVLQVEAARLRRTLDRAGLLDVVPEPGGSG